MSILSYMQDEELSKVKKLFYTYILLIIGSFLAALVIALLYGVVLFFVTKFLGISATDFNVSFGQIVSLGENFFLLITLSPIGIIVFLGTIFLNPVGQGIMTIINIVFGVFNIFLNIIVNGVGHYFGVNVLFNTNNTWSQVNTDSWITDFTNFVTAMKSIIMTPVTVAVTGTTTTANIIKSIKF